MSKRHKVFISYHRADTKYEEKIERILKDNDIDFYSVDKNADFTGWKNQAIADYILPNMDDCDIFLLILGKETYSRPHVDWEIHKALKGDINTRKGIVVVMLESRCDSKKNIDLETFPEKLKDNLNYIVLEQYASITDRLVLALEEAYDNSKNKALQNNHTNPVKKIRKTKYEAYKEK